MKERKPPLRMRVEGGTVGMTPAEFGAGDMLDLGKDGVITWFTGQDADDFRRAFKSREWRRTLIGRLFR